MVGKRGILHAVEISHPRGIPLAATGEAGSSVAACQAHGHSLGDDGFEFGGDVFVPRGAGVVVFPVQAGQLVGWHADNL